MMQHASSSHHTILSLEGKHKFRWDALSNFAILQANLSSRNIWNQLCVNDVFLWKRLQKYGVAGATEGNAQVPEQQKEALATTGWGMEKC